MKRSVQIIILLAVLSVASGCATPFMTDRRRDAADIFTIGVEKNTLGVTAQVGPLLTGLNIQTAQESDCGGFGLRGGSFGTYKSYDIELAVFGYKYFEPGADTDRLKKFERPQFLCLMSSGKGWFGGEFGSRSGCEYGNVEVSASLGVGLRLGFNPGELLDFVLGWGGIDIFSDDLNKSEGQAQSEAASRPQLTLEQRRHLRETYLKEQDRSNKPLESTR